MASPRSKPKKSNDLAYNRQTTSSEAITLNVAKVWRRSVLRLANKMGYSDKAPKESGWTVKEWFRRYKGLRAEWRLYQSVTALVESEKR